MVAYTVVLHDCHNDYPNFYVEAANAAEAVEEAARESLNTRHDEMRPAKPVPGKEYEVCAVFCGHVPIAAD
jgi:hypothetical protein